MVILQIEASHGIGSTGRITRDIQVLVERRGWTCYVASPVYSKNLSNNPHLYKVGNWIDHKLHALFCRIHGKQAYFSTLPTLRLIKFIQKIKPDIIQFHDLHSNYIDLNLLLKHIAKTNIRLVITLHDCWMFTGGCFHYTSVGCNKWMKECGDCPKRFVDTPAYFGDRSRLVLKDRIKYLNSVKDLTIVGVSQWISNEFRNSKITAQRVLTIHNGIDLNVFKPIKPTFKKRLGIENKFVMLGPATKWFLDINNDTLKYFIDNMSSDMVLLLFGCAEKRKGLPGNVIQFEFTRNVDDLVDLYSSADVMVNCSREDTLSTINLEAQACGTPVVTYDATGSSETVDGNCGFAIETGNFNLLYKSVMKIKEDGKSNYTDFCRAFIQTNFCKEKRYEDYIDLFNKLTLI